MVYRFLRYPEGKCKAVTFSYDDLFTYDRKLSDILTEHGLKGTFNVNSSSLGGKNHLSREEVQTWILDRGHEVAVHGEFHRANGLVRPVEGIRDVLNCRIDLEKAFDRIIRGMAYPDSGIGAIQNGGNREEIKQYLVQLDIAYARTAKSDVAGFMLPEDWYAWTPTAHHGNPELFSEIEKFLDLSVDTLYRSSRYPRLFFVWGHSFEFERNGNWDLLERICKALGGREEIWYATNMEIYEYVSAYHSLVFSADGERVYNPTLKKIWFDVDGKQYKIAPGETITISN